MERLTQGQLDEVIARHQHWLREDCEGWEDMRANLYRADLSRANLSGADLSGANLSGANLSRANLSRANLSGANIEETIGIPPIACPSEGTFIGFKRCRDSKIVKLIISADAKRSSATGRKCRCSEATVVDIFDADDESVHFAEAHSIYKNGFVYKVGEIVRSEFDEDRWNECAPGIHFFITKQEARDYNG